MQKTYTATPKDIDRKWYVVDLDGVVLGRAATKIATILRGKNKPGFTPHMDTGDFVIVINAEKVKLTGNKWHDKLYHKHTGYIGHLKTINAEDLRAKHPERLIEHAVKGMLPKNKMGNKLIKKLKIYAGPNHKHEAQKPIKLNLAEMK